MRCGKYVNIFSVNKSFLKFVTDFGPLAIFFFYYYNSDKNLSIAIPPLIVATLVALAVVWFFEKKIPMMPLVSGILITFFGGLTIYFDNPVFIYIKPTIINILFGLALIFGRYFTNEPVLKKLMGKSIPLTNEGWELLSKRWIYYMNLKNLVPNAGHSVITIMLLSILEYLQRIKLTIIPD